MSGITYDRFIEMALQAGANSVVSGFTPSTFEFYCWVYGPMTEALAWELIDGACGAWD